MALEEIWVHCYFCKDIATSIKFNKIVMLVSFIPRLPARPSVYCTEDLGMRLGIACYRAAEYNSTDIYT